MYVSDKAAKKETSVSGIDLKLLLVEKSWSDLLSEEFDKDYVKQLEKSINQDLQNGKTVFPPKDEIFNAFALTPLNQVCVYLIIIAYAE